MLQPVASRFEVGVAEAGIPAIQIFSPQLPHTLRSNRNADAPGACRRYLVWYDAGMYAPRPERDSPCSDARPL